MAVRHRYLARLAASAISAVALVGMLVGQVHSSVYKKGNHVQITNLDIIDDDVYTSGSRLTMDGVINGDLTSFNYQIEINGEVGQSANLFCRTLQHNGKIDGSLRALAENITVAGYVTRSAVLMGRDVNLAKGAIIERDLKVFGSTVQVDGTVKGNASITGEIVEITGVIAGDIDIDAQKIMILAPAVIAGNLTYTSHRQAEIDSTAGVTISGKTTWNLPKKNEDQSSGINYTSIVVRISSLFAAFVFGILALFVFRGYVEEAVEQVRSRFSVAIAAGLLGIFVLILSLTILLLSIASMIAGFLMISGDLAPLGSLVLVFSILMLPITSFASISGGILLYSGKIVLAFIIGYAILKYAKPSVGILSKSSLFLGLLILTLVFMIPYVGFILYILISLVGIGGILLGIKHCRKGTSAQSGPPPADATI